MKFGVFSVSMPEYNLEEAVKQVKEMGYDGIEWRVDVLDVPEYFKNMKEIPYAMRYWVNNKATLDVNNIMEYALKAKALCDEAGLEIFGFSTSLNFMNPETLEPVLAAANAIGVHNVRAGMFNFNPNGDRSFPEVFEECKAGTKAMEPMLRKYNVKLLMELHHGTVNASASSAYRMLQDMDPEWFGVIFDPGNMVYEGRESYVKGVELLGPYLAHVHVKNGILQRAGEDELGSAKWNQVWTPLNEGMADLLELFKALKKGGYDGTISVEDFSNERPTAEKLQYNIAYMKKLAEAAGYSL